MRRVADINITGWNFPLFYSYGTSLTNHSFTSHITALSTSSPRKSKLYEHTRVWHSKYPVTAKLTEAFIAGVDSTYISELLLMSDPVCPLLSWSSCVEKSWCVLFLVMTPFRFDLESERVATTLPIMLALIMPVKLTAEFYFFICFEWGKMKLVIVSDMPLRIMPPCRKIWQRQIMDTYNKGASHKTVAFTGDCFAW